MICKELDPYSGGDNKFMLAGRAAEEQLAFYLRRAFEHAPRTHVFNGLRFEKDGDAAQIDHLLLHTWGLVIVESKSVVGEVTINEHQEWARRFGTGPWMGMPSPILQGKRQGEFLRRFMEDNVTHLLSKMLGIQKHFGALRLDVLVAISDRGVIRRPKKPDLSEICKADQVPERATAMMDHLAKVNSPLGFFSLNLKDLVLDLDKEAMDRMTQFLLENHHPLSSTAVQGRPGLTPARTRQQHAQEARNGTTSPVSPVPLVHYPPAAGNSKECRSGRLQTGVTEQVSSAALAPSSQPSAQNQDVSATNNPLRPVPSCKGCAAEAQGRILYGKFGYYFKCDACGTNTNINEPCPRCRERSRLRKQGPTFTLECGACSFAGPYHVNPA